jgi:hypothetical protein
MDSSTGMISAPLATKVPSLSAEFPMHGIRTFQKLGVSLAPGSHQIFGVRGAVEGDF